MAEVALKHTPVKLQRCLDLLAPAIDRLDPVMVDATLGLGGHTEAALQRFPDLTVVGIDRDPIALTLAGERLARFGDRFRPFQGTFDQIPEALDGGQAAGILMDLGVSSMQLDEVDRGFSYAHDAPLDMRMNPEEGVGAAELLNTIEGKDLARILWRYGDEKFAARIADGVVQARAKAPLETTGQLVQIIRESIPAAARRTGGNPAKRTFQAIRIAVNDELGILERALPVALSCLAVEGRMVVMSYQSLEDRLVKTIFRQGTSPEAPPGLPLTAQQLDDRRVLRSLTRGAERADADEVNANPRSLPVRLRAVEVLSLWRHDVR